MDLSLTTLADALGAFRTILPRIYPPKDLSSQGFPRRRGLSWRRLFHYVVASHQVAQQSSGPRRAGLLRRFAPRYDEPLPADQVRLGGCRDHRANRGQGEGGKGRRRGAAPRRSSFYYWPTPNGW